jgi:hypothetical protein
MTATKLVPVRYVGQKPRARDNLLNRHRLVWEGYGDVKWVPEDDARVYCAYEDQWQLAEDLANVQVHPITGKPITSFAPAADPAVDSLPVDDVGNAAGADPESDDDQPGSGEPAGLAALSEIERATRLNKIINAYPKLGRKDFQIDGRPHVYALSRVLGMQIYAAERNVAHDAIQRSMREAEYASASAEMNVE